MRCRLAQNLSYLNGNQARLIPPIFTEKIGERVHLVIIPIHGPSHQIHLFQFVLAKTQFFQIRTTFGKNRRKRNTYVSGGFLQSFRCFIIWNELCLEILTFTIMQPLCRAYAKTYVWWTEKARVNQYAPIKAYI